VNINQLKQLRNLNVELLETLIQTLHSIDNYCRQHAIPLLTDKEIENLVRHTLKLIREINTEISIPLRLKLKLESRNLSDDFLQKDRTDEDFTESFWKIRILRCC